MKFIISYNEAWPLRFEQIARSLRDILPATCRFHHVGSTAVLGMPAKDIIDLDIECPDGSMASIIAALDGAGYAHRGDLGIPTREAFSPKAGSLAATFPEHHLYACESQSPELFKHLAFRDYLIQHTERAAWLAAQKIIVDQSANSREAYIENKADAYAVITREALG